MSGGGSDKPASPAVPDVSPEAGESDQAGAQGTFSWVGGPDDGSTHQKLAEAHLGGSVFPIQRFADAGTQFPAGFTEMGVDESRCIDWGVMEYGRVISAEPYPPRLSRVDGLLVWLRDPRA